MAIRLSRPKQRLEEADKEEQFSQAAQQETDIYGAEKDTSVFGEAAADMEMKQPVPGEVAQAVQDMSDERKAKDTYVQDVFTGTEPDQGDQGDGGGAAEEPDEPQGLFEDLGDIDTRQERERQAFADELEARRAEAMQQAQARAGLGGMGLSGATAELTADIGRQEARAGDIAMADLARRQQQETFDDLRRQASIWTFEEEFGVDLDGDGNYGTPPEKEPETFEDSVADAERKNKEARQKRKETQDAMSEKIGQDVGAVEDTDNPLDVISPMNEDMGTYESDTGATWRVYRRPDGTFFKVLA